MPDNGNLVSAPGICPSSPYQKSRLLFSHTYTRFLNECTPMIFAIVGPVGTHAATLPLPVHFNGASVPFTISSVGAVGAVESAKTVYCQRSTVMVAPPVRSAGLPPLVISHSSALVAARKYSVAPTCSDISVSTSSLPIPLAT